MSSIRHNTAPDGVPTNAAPEERNHHTMRTQHNRNHHPAGRLLDQVTTTVEEVAPGVALAWLEANTQNRKVRQSRVDQYARDMAAGNWKRTGETIKFAADGRLLDGQHRLWAVVEADVPVCVDIVRGLDPDTQSYMDTGVARTAADDLGMRGERNSPVLSAAARLGALAESHRLFRDHTTQLSSHAEIYEWLREHPGLRDSVAFVDCGKPKKVALPPSVKAYAHYRFAGLDPEDADGFFNALGALVNLPEGSPILALASRLRTLREQRQKRDPAVLLALAFRGWNAWRAGRSMSLIPLKAATSGLPTLR